MDKEKLKRYLRLLPTVLVLILCIMVFARILAPKQSTLKITEAKWSKLLLVLDQIDRNYVDTVNTSDLIEKLLPSLMEGLDPHSLYLPPVELEEANESLEGNFSGIGVQFNVPSDTAVIIGVIKGGPSEKAGILTGDRIITIEGDTIAGVNFPQDSIVRRLKGPRGTSVKIQVKRSEEPKLLDFTIVRDIIPVNSVDVAYMIGESTGYIKVEKFTKTTYLEFMKATVQLKSKGMKSLVIDLRENAGGYFDQALLMANEFLGNGKLIVYLEGAHRKRQDFFADGSGTMLDLPLTVLINENSASSSEIFAGAIQDNDRGLIVGRRSYGKGLVQEPLFFSDNSGIRLTVARYFTPTGRSIQKPYSEDYRYDIYKRYQSGEMMDADSIKVNDSLKFVTPGGKIVYGGGGIIPDKFVPVDTTGVTDFLIKVNRKSLVVKCSSYISDKYRKQLAAIDTLPELDRLFKAIDFKQEFLDYSGSNGVNPRAGEWNVSGRIIEEQLKGLVGRYTKLGDDAFYPYILTLDNTIDTLKARKIIK